MQQRDGQNATRVYNLKYGSVAERLKAPVLKTGDGATRS